MRGHRVAGLLALSAVLSACTVGPDYHAPETPMPAGFAATSADAAAHAAPSVAVDLTRWWASLNDPELQSLIERAVKASPDIEIALTRLQEARTVEGVLLGQSLPAVVASGAAGRGTGNDLTRGRAT